MLDFLQKIRMGLRCLFFSIEFLKGFKKGMNRLILPIKSKLSQF
jgi:hypothetical protein